MMVAEGVTRPRMSHRAAASMLRQMSLPTIPVIRCSRTRRPMRPMTRLRPTPRATVRLRRNRIIASMTARRRPKLSRARCRRPTIRDRRRARSKQVPQRWPSACRRLRLCRRPASPVMPSKAVRSNRSLPTRLARATRPPRWTHCSTLCPAEMAQLGHLPIWQALPPTPSRVGTCRLHGGFAASHDMMFNVHAAMQHHDAVQPVANG